jgi:hypothetical protein
MGKWENTRNSFVKMRGGKLISIESVILAFVVFFVLTMVKNASPYLSLVVAFVVGFVFPILVGTFKSLAWIAAILFSLVWAFLGFVIVGAIADGSILIGIVGAVILFAISFAIHKNYSGLSFQNINNKTNNTENIVINNSSIKENVVFCPKCGRRIRSVDGRCDTCDR